MSFPSIESIEPMSIIGSQQKERQEAIKDLKKNLRSKKTTLGVQNLTHHRPVLALLYKTQARKERTPHEQLSYQLSRSLNKGVYFSRKLVEWEDACIRYRLIPKEKRGCHTNTSSSFNDEGVQMAVREWCAGVGESKLFYFILFYSILFCFVLFYFLGHIIQHPAHIIQHPKSTFT